MQHEPAAIHSVVDRVDSVNVICWLAHSVYAPRYGPEKVHAVQIQGLGFQPLDSEPRAVQSAIVEERRIVERDYSEQLPIKHRMSMPEILVQLVKRRLAVPTLHYIFL